MVPLRTKITSVTSYVSCLQAPWRTGEPCLHQTYPVRGEIQHPLLGAFEGFRLARHVTEGELHILTLLEHTAGGNRTSWRDSLTDSSDTQTPITQSLSVIPKYWILKQALEFSFWTHRDDLPRAEEFLLLLLTTPVLLHKEER